MRETVFVLKGDMAYEGSETLGVYSTITNAENAMRDHKKTAEFEAFERYSITKFIVNEGAFSDQEKIEDDDPRPTNSYDEELIE